MWPVFQQRARAHVARQPVTGRDAAVDLVRSAALLRVIVFHASGNLVALTVAPAMPIMFFLGGRFAARSLDRRPGADVIADRARRLLVPATAYVVVITIGLIVAGHPARDIASSLANSVVPRGVGSGDVTADWFFSTLWYLRDYLIGIALSPLLLGAVRTRPRWTALLMLVAVAASFALDLGSLTTMYLSFWLLGMAGSTRPAFLPPPERQGWKHVGAAVVAVVAAGALLSAGTWPWSQAGGNLLAGLGWLTILGALVEPITRFAQRPVIALGTNWLQQRAVSTYLWQMVPVIALFRLAGLTGRSLGDAWQAIWIIPSAVVCTLALAAVTSPLERRAARRSWGLINRPPGLSSDGGAPAATRRPGRRSPR